MIQSGRIVEYKKKQYLSQAGVNRRAEASAVARQLQLL